ncbi:MAG TPA: TetR/AcrR family transcriptional regulator [Sphingobium sp.]|nr:TetR/AcrR family transcriptional regulator [Sphingobium sp.]
MPPPRKLIEDKKAVVLGVAGRMFLATGYTDVSIDAIVAEVGGSKSFIYNNFGSKGDLFIAVIAELCESIAAPLVSLDTSTLGCEDGLRAIGTRFVELSLSERSLDLHRLVVAERLTFPQIGQVFMETGPRNSFEVVARFMANHQSAGVLKEDVDSTELAMIFLGMLNAGWLVSLLTLAGTRPSKRRVAQRVRNGSCTTRRMCPRTSWTCVSRSIPSQASCRRWKISWRCRSWKYVAPTC